MATIPTLPTTLYRAALEPLIRELEQTRPHWHERAIVHVDAALAGAPAIYPLATMRASLLALADSVVAMAVAYVADYVEQAITQEAQRENAVVLAALGLDTQPMH